MSSQSLHRDLLRTPIIQILRSAGFHSTKSSVLDTLTDLAARYLQLLAYHTALHAQHNHNDLIPDVTDVRLALMDVGALRPQLSAMEEQWRGKEDMRGVENFLSWAKGENCKEIRRVAGMIKTEGEVVDVEGVEGNEDFLTCMPYLLWDQYDLY
jgi:transcription initiation factor TFIID subunit 3